MDPSITIPPAAILVFLSVFAGVLWPWQARSINDRGLATTEHSERVYKVFEFYVKVALAITGAMGYVRLNYFASEPLLARQAMVVLGWIALGVMMFSIIFVWCHQGSKLRRWTNIEWPKIVFWQEIWMAIGMYVYATALWVVAHKW